jgi:hypothetical protein
MSTVSTNGKKAKKPAKTPQRQGEQDRRWLQLPNFWNPIRRGGMRLREVECLWQPVSVGSAVPGRNVAGCVNGNSSSYVGSGSDIASDAAGQRRWNRQLQHANEPCCRTWNFVVFTSVVSSLACGFNGHFVSEVVAAAFTAEMYSFAGTFSGSYFSSGC